jgi:hypothetical protein
MFYINFWGKSMERIVTTAKILQPLLVVFSIFYLWKTAGGTLDYALLSPERWQNDVWAHPEAKIAMTTRWVYLIVWMTPIIFGLLAIGIAALLLRRVEKGTLFDGRIASGFQGIGVCVAASGAADLLANYVQPALISWHNPDGRLPPSFYFNSESAGLILCGGGFFLVGWIMAEAIKIAEDNKGFV